MKQFQKPTIEEVLSHTKPCEQFLCSVKDNVYGLYFQEFRIRDADTNRVIFEIKRDPAEAKAAILDESDENRQIRYSFTPDFFQIKTIGTTLIFGVGSKPLKNLKMIERHYFLDKLIKSYEFTFPFCIPDSTNNWEAIYQVPQIDEEQQLMMIINPGATRSDSFYFVEDELIMHHKAEYDYATLNFLQEQEKDKQRAAEQKLIQK